MGVNLQGYIYVILLYSLMEEEINLINAVLQSDQYTALAKINEGSYG